MENNNDKKIKIYITLLITVICIIGVSYAYFRLVLSQTDNNSLASRTCFSTTLTEQTSKIALTDVYPVTDEEGIKGTPYTFTIKNNCTGYVKATITIDSEYRTQTSTSYLKDDYVKVNLSKSDVLTQGNMHLGNQELVDLDNSRKGYKLLEIKMGPNQEFTYDLRIWLDADTDLEQGLNKKWEGKIVVATVAIKDPAAPNGWNEAADGTLLAAIRRDNPLRDTLTIPGNEVSAYTLDSIPVKTGTVSSAGQSVYITYGTGWEANGTGFNLTGTAVTADTYENSYSDLVGKYLPYLSIYNSGSSTAGTKKTTNGLSSIYYVVSATASSYTYKTITSNKNTTEAILASTEDDYGTSYYFRGTVTNNFVEYANMCWRIVRVTGDGSIKLVLYNYNGLTSTNNTPSSSTPCNVTGDTYAYARYEENQYNTEFNETDGDNAYIGLMYGTVAGDSYSSVHSNTMPSNMLTNLNKWYTNVLSKQTVFNNNQLADTIWCNDKKTMQDLSFNPWEWNFAGFGYNGDQTMYSSMKRLINKNYTAGGDGPNLICSNDDLGGKLSKFTVNDTTYGNGALKDYAKIGLLTADEVAFAGEIYDINNLSYYLYQNADSIWWTLTPIGFQGEGAVIWGVTSNDVGDLGLYRLYAMYEFGLRPAISLTSSIKISSGNGTATNPYKIAA